MEAIFKRDKDQKVSAKIDGIIGPAHVSIIIGITPYERFVKIYRLPVVIAGFEPLDVMQAVKMLISQINSNSAVVENEFTRAVTRDGNVVALNAINEVFEIRDFFEWRGLGTIPHSALKLSESFSDFDAEKRFDLNYKRVLDHKDCECGAILKGEKRPQECKIFGTSCTPETPIGSCMVSSEGACAAHYSFGRFRNIPVNSAFVD